jgi:hypothetical protein
MNPVGDVDLFNIHGHGIWDGDWVNNFSGYQGHDIGFGVFLRSPTSMAEIQSIGCFDAGLQIGFKVPI